MKKTTLILLSPLCLLYANMDRPDIDTAPQKIEKEKDATLPWSRDDLVKARDSADKAREKRSQEIEKAANEIVDSRDGNNHGDSDVELDDIQNNSTILEMKPKDANSKTSIIIEKPKSIEKPKIDGIQLEVIKAPSPVGVKKESIVVVTQIKKEGSAPKVIEVVAISKTVDSEIERPIVESEMQEEILELDEPIVEEKRIKSAYPSHFIFIKKSH